MRTNIEIDDNLIKEAMNLCGVSTKKEAVNKALELLCKKKKQQKILKYKGKLLWEGDLKKMRGK